MKKLQLSLILFLTLQIVLSCSPNKGVEFALNQVPEEQREGVEFLLKYMPQGDKDTLSADFLIEEVAWAYKARETFGWTKKLSDSIFFNEVLPYASMNEAREPFRERFWNMLYPLVKDETDIVKAIGITTRALPELTGVEYNTKRNRPHQAPSESIEIGMASCSGLSIILVDALRTLGIPARIAGTPLWVSKEGNHNWVEVNIDGNWYFTEYYPAENFNEGWFLERAGKADKSDKIYWIYATSWATTADSLHFPMVWNEDDFTVPGVDVTDFYIDLYNKELATKGNGIAVGFKMFKTQSGERSSGDRVKCDLVILDSEGKNLAAGTTASPTADMNDYLTLYLPANSSCTAQFHTEDGSVKDFKFEVKEDSQIVELFYQ